MRRRDRGARRLVNYLVEVAAGDVRVPRRSRQLEREVALAQRFALLARQGQSQRKGPGAGARLVRTCNRVGSRAVEEALPLDDVAVEHVIVHLPGHSSGATNWQALATGPDRRINTPGPARRGSRG